MCSAPRMLSLRPRVAFPKGDALPRPRDALPQAGLCIPPGTLSPRPRDSLPKELSLPTTAAQSSGCRLRGLGEVVSRVPPQEVPQGSGAGRGCWGAGGGPTPLPAASPAPQRTPRLPPPLAHAFGCSSPPHLQSLASCSLRHRCPRPHPALTPPSSHGHQGSAGSAQGAEVGGCTVTPLHGCSPWGADPE